MRATASESIASASRRAARGDERMLAAAASLALGAIAVIADIEHPRAFAFSPVAFAAYATVLASAQVFVTILLLWRSRLIGDARASRIAAAFVYTVPLIVLYGLTFPHVGPSWLWQASGSSWLWFGWRIGWPIGIVAYTAAPRFKHESWERSALIALMTAGVVAALALTNVLPNAFAEDQQTLRPILSVTAGLSLAITLVALARIVRLDPLTSLDLWLTVALVAIAMSDVIVLSNMSRFSGLADIARLLGLISTAVVVCALISEFARLVAASSTLDRVVSWAEYSSAIVYIKDPFGACTYVNRAWTRTTGQDKAAALGAGWQQVVHPDDLATNRARVAAAVAAERDYDVQERYRQSDGTYRWHLATSTPIVSPNGAIEGWYGVAIDIDDERRALEDAQRLENDVRRIAETIPLIAWTGRPDGSIDWYNQRWYDYTGQSVVTALADGWSSALHPDDAPAAIAAWATSVATGEPYDREFRLRGADGGMRWFLARATPIRGTDGAVIRWYGTNTDIDETRRQADHVAALYARERIVSQTLQSAYLPPFLPTIPGVTLRATYRSATSGTEVGGDWYDVFVLRDGRVALSVGDVCGHGLEAASAMVRLRETLRAAAGFVHADAATILMQADRAFTASMPDAIATAVFALYDPHTHRLEIAGAGHPPPVIVRNGRAQRLSYSGVPLGVAIENHIDAHVHVLEADDLVYFYTDGMIETDGDPIGGERRFLAAVERCEGDLDALVADVIRGEQRDDIAVLTLAVVPTVSQTSWRFSSDDAASAGDARSAFTGHLRRRGVDEHEIAGAELVFGELVGNVVRHAPGPIEIELRWTDGASHVIVRDRGPVFEIDRVGLPGDMLSDHGRGLYIIATVAAAPTVTRRPGGGNEVSVALALNAAPPVPDGV